jgi:hypothetical protein
VEGRVCAVNRLYVRAGHLCSNLLPTHRYCATQDAIHFFRDGVSHCVTLPLCSVACDPSLESILPLADSVLPLSQVCPLT